MSESQPIPIRIATDQKVTPKQFIDVLERSGLAERRPVDDADCIDGMLAHADLMVTAWIGDLLIGVARSVTDFSYCCYLSDLAVDQDYQRLGIGKVLIDQTREQLGEQCQLILLSAPAATDYYPKIGFEPHPRAFVI